MWINGLWKLAAMAGVIGVGVVAVFQAHRGLDSHSTENDPAAEVALSENGNVSQGPSGVDPVSTAESWAKNGNGGKNSGDGLPSVANPFEGTSDSRGNTKSNLQPKATLVSGPGLSFQSGSPKTASSAVNSKPKSSKSSVRQVAFNSDETPEVDPFGTDPAAPTELPPAPKTVSPQEPPAADPFGSGDVDPFSGDTPDLNAKPKVTSPDTSSETTTTPGLESTDSPSLALPEPTPAAPPATINPAKVPESDPFGDANPFGNDSSPTTTKPAKSNPQNDDLTVDPFGTESGGTESGPRMAPRNSVPASPADPDLPEPTPSPSPSRSEPFRRQRDDVDSFGADPNVPSLETAPSLEPRLPEKSPSVITPRRRNAEPIGSDSFGNEPLPLDSIPATRPAPRNSPSRLPTDVSSPNTTRSNDTLGDEPARLRNSVPTRRTPDRSSDPRSLDFQGDGVIGANAPRGVQQPRVTIEKIAPKQAVLGEEVIYSVIVKNAGNSDAHQVVVEDRIPKGTELLGTSPRAEMVDKRLLWRIGTLRPGEEKKISIKVNPLQPGPIGSVARVNFAAEVAAEIMVAAPQLTLTGKAPKEVRVGERVELFYLLKNTGTAPATNVVVRDIVPEGLKHAAAADIECPIGKLGPNESREIVLQVTAVKPGRVTNQAYLSADGGIADQVTSVIDIIGEQLVLTRSGQNRLYVDKPAIYTNSIRNDGNARVEQVRVVEVVPVGMEVSEATDGGRYDRVERAIIWTLGPLAPGDERAVSAKLIGKSAGLHQGKITAKGAAGSEASLKSEIDVVGRPELQVESINTTGIVAVGDRLVSKIQLRNHGSAVARNVALSIRVPNELTIQEIKSKHQYRQTAGNVIQFDPISQLGAKDVATFEIVMSATAEAQAQMGLEITADHLAKPARRSETIQIANELP